MIFKISLSYSYWTVGGIVACGQGNIEQNDHLKQVEQIDESFLKNAENFAIENNIDVIVVDDKEENK